MGVDDKLAKADAEKTTTNKKTVTKPAKSKVEESVEEASVENTVVEYDYSDVPTQHLSGADVLLAKDKEIFRVKPDVFPTEAGKRVMVLPDELKPGGPNILFESKDGPTFPKEFYYRYYYGSILPGGLVEVRKRDCRMAGLYRKYNDRVIWYERKVIIDGGEPSSIAYHVIHEPNSYELWPEYFYCATQWNISRVRLMDQDNMPEWRRMVSMNHSVNPPKPYMASSPNRPISPIRAFHYIITNRGFRPEKRVVEGKTIDMDGMYVQSRPVSGKYIMDYKKAVESSGGTPDGLLRQRSSGDGLSEVSI